MPFVVEGFILGFLGALIAFFLQWGLYDFVAMKVAEIDSLQLITVAPFLDVIEPVALIYALTGFVVGVFGSLLSIRKFPEGVGQQNDLEEFHAIQKQIQTHRLHRAGRHHDAVAGVDGADPDGQRGQLEGDREGAGRPAGAAGRAESSRTR